MKKRVLKKWVEVVLAFILLISLLVLGGEVKSYFIVSKMIAMTTFIGSGYLLIKYGKEV